MLFDPLDNASFRKLNDAARASYKQLEPFRSERLKCLRQFVGMHYGNDGAEDKVPLNFMQQAVQTYARRLVGRFPRVRGSSRFRELEAYAHELKDAINESIQEMNLQATLEEVVLNALFGMGIAKVGITATSDDEEGFLHDAGEPFVDCVDLSDWVHDMNAKRQEAWQFCGNRYELPRRVVIADETLDPAVRKAATAKQQSMRQSMEAKRHDPHELEQGKPDDDNDLYEQVELWDYWLPKDGLLVTYCADHEDKPARVVSWSGPEEGPYHILAYQKVPNNIMPLPPAVQWLDLHELINTLARKAGRQAERQKTITFAATQAVAEAEKVRDAKDGEIVPVTDPSLIKEARYGGAEPATIALIQQLRQFANLQAGNIDAMAGLAPQSGTVGQDKLLHEAASDTLIQMQKQTELFVQGICQDIGYYLFEDPSGIKLLQRRVEGLDVSVPQLWGPDRRVGKFYQYNIEIVPYSMEPQTGQQKLQQLNTLLTQVFGPMLPIMMQQGYGFDFQRFIDLVSNYSDMPELAQVLIPVDPNLAAQQGGEQPTGPKQPRSSVREYVSNAGGQKADAGLELMKLAASQSASNASP